MKLPLPPCTCLVTTIWPFALLVNEQAASLDAVTTAAHVVAPTGTNPLLGASVTV